MDKQTIEKELKIIQKYFKNINEYIPLGEIKSSGNRSVELVQDKEENYYVMKKIKYSLERAENFYFIREAYCLVKAQEGGFPFVQLIECQLPKPKEDGYIITTYMEGGNVMKQISNKNENDSIKEETSSDTYLSDNLPQYYSSDIIPTKIIDLNKTRKMIIIYGTAKAISFLHHQKPPIFHRDIKPENILLDANGEPHLSDFGFAREILMTEKMSDIKGTHPYMSPELIRDEDVTFNSDIYSFGVTMIMIFSEKLTITEKGTKYDFYKLNQRKKVEYVSKGVKYDMPTDIPNQLSTLITNCCDIDPSKRPSIDEIIAILESDQVTSLYDSQYKDYINKFKK